MNNFIKEAQQLKARAVALREAKDFKGSEQLLLKAQQMLSARMPDGKCGPAGPMEMEVAKALANICGSLGGTYREWGRFEESVNAYDDGFEYEDSPRYGIVNSYNLVQRLVARILFDRDWALAPERTILKKKFPGALECAEAEIQTQLRGSRQNDEYALADQAMIALLLGRTTHLELWRRLRGYAKNQFVIEATSRVLDEIQKNFDTDAASKPGSDHLDAFLLRVREARESL